MVSNRFWLSIVPSAMLLAVVNVCSAFQASDQPRVLSLDHTPSLGDKRALLAIVEFGDYQCPFCGRHATQTLPLILANYVNSGKVRYFFKDAPIEVIHPQALKAAEAAQCAGAQGKYWELHDLLFRNQTALTPTDLTAHAVAANLDLHRFQQCLDDGTFVAQIRASVQQARNYGVRGTPQFFLGTLLPDSLTFKVELTLSGAVPYTDFQRALDDLLSVESVGTKR